MAGPFSVAYITSDYEFPGTELAFGLVDLPSLSLHHVLVPVLFLTEKTVIPDTILGKLSHLPFSLFKSPSGAS